MLRILSTTYVTLPPQTTPITPNNSTTASRTTYTSPPRPPPHSHAPATPPPLLADPASPPPLPGMHTARIQRDNVLRRETLEGEAYIGDAGSTPTLDLRVDSLRIAATNINKNTYGKLSAELATWPHNYGHLHMGEHTHPA
ncbi:hypothetical protein H257_18386 [Aphanomyces astaci]|uniref:Uncharacterized protein n=1 Tax=Aphanomyces astaci TaxID=112090 RepID=W4FBD0_APHAT|nr:hypothetical protein H257_18386 [Aphanomyces astaci]ETV64787.1 hypothetical protein H257_18386 [Aphanomyces astaci]|eukprot:XP_009845730.1 hypothetical protein H257_18386 [Aphanomyces astaci]